MNGQIELDKRQINSIKDNLHAFDVNIRDYKITKGDYGGFYVYIPHDTTGSWMYYAQSLKELEGWMMGVVQGLNRKELKEIWQRNRDYYLFEERKNNENR